MRKEKVRCFVGTSRVPSVMLREMTMAPVAFRGLLVPIRFKSYSHSMILFRQLTRRHPDVRHWLNINVEWEGVRVIASRMKDPETNRKENWSFGSIAIDRSAYGHGKMLAKGWKAAQGMRQLVLRGVHVQQKRMQTNYADAVINAVRGISESGIQVLIDVNVLCSLMMISKERRPKIEALLFIPMREIPGVEVYNLRSLPTADQDEEYDAEYDPDPRPCSLGKGFLQV